MAGDMTCNLDGMGKEHGVRKLGAFVVIDAGKPLGGERCGVQEPHGASEAGAVTERRAVKIASMNDELKLLNNELNGIECDGCGIHLI